MLGCRQQAPLELFYLQHHANIAAAFLHQGVCHSPAAFIHFCTSLSSEALCLKDCYTLSEIHNLNQHHDSLKGHQMTSYDIKEICSWALPEAVITPTSGLNTIDDIRLSWIHPCM